MKLLIFFYMVHLSNYCIKYAADHDHLNFLFQYYLMTDLAELM